MDTLVLYYKKGTFVIKRTGARTSQIGLEVVNGKLLRLPLPASGGQKKINTSILK